MHSDRNLLFGILAVEMDFVERDALFGAMHRWVLEKSRTLGEILVEAGNLAPSRRSLLEALVDEHVKQHASDACKSLAALPHVNGLARPLLEIADADLKMSLAHWNTPPDGGAESDATLIPDSGPPAGVETRYRVLRPHAAGGIGIVSIALDEELHREVALKEIRDPYAQHPENRERFVREAEITGGLEHPGIVPVYGLGKYQDGRPFYAMRLIRGESLLDAIHHFHRADNGASGPSQRSLELRRLLGRFVDVCLTIEYAHSRGVLHRDLKPGNIMLGKYGETLVVDWGLSKPLGEPQTPDTPEPVLHASTSNVTTPTQQGSTIGTPQYMSPEQAEGRLDQVGPASDIYSLGATLYELLTGRTPFEGEDISGTLRKVCAGDFPQPRSLDHRVPRTLEAICLQAMRRRIDDRYTSARALADDVEHWLADEPVAAYRESISEQVSRWARRHRSWVRASAAALALVAFVSFVAAVWVNSARRDAIGQRNSAVDARQREAEQRAVAMRQRDEARRAQREADLARGRAEDAERRASREAASATAVSDFLVGMFQGSDFFGFSGYEFAGGGQGRADLTARELLDLGSETIQTKLSDQPAIHAKLLDTVGVTYLSLGLTQEAAPLLERALALRREQYLEAPHPDLADSLRDVGMLRLIQGYIIESQRMIRQALAMRSEFATADDPDIVLDKFCLAWSLMEPENTRNEAEQLYREVLEARRRLRGEGHRDTAYATIGLALVLIGRGDQDEALLLIGDAASTFAHLDDDVNPIKPAIQFVMAVAHIQTGNVEYGKQMIRETIDLSNRIAGEHHPLAIYIQVQIALYLGNVGELDIAEELLRRSATLEREAIGDHPRTAMVMNFLAQVLQRREKREEAERWVRDALAIYDARVDDDDPNKAYALATLGVLLSDRSEYEEASSIHRRVLSIFRESFPGTSLSAGRAQCRLGYCLLEMQKFDQAEPFVLGGYEEIKSVSGAEHPWTREALALVVRFYEAWDKEEKAAEYRDLLPGNSGKP